MGVECRHIQWTRWGYIGSGSYAGDWNDCRQYFHAFLDVMATASSHRMDNYSDVVSAIEAEVGKNAFWAQLEGFSLCTPTLHFYRLRPDLPHLDFSTGLLFARIKVFGLGDQDTGDAAIGFLWLKSLEDAKTVKANQRTVEWIHLWRANRRIVIL